MTRGLVAVDYIIEKIKNSQSVVLSTHRQCDGDGLGAELGLFHALNKIGKKCDVINVDRTPKKYRFLKPDEHITYFEESRKPLDNYDVCLIFDTNDRRLLSDLYPEFERVCGEIIFIDHHPQLQKGPMPTKNSFIDVSAASTGELSYKIIKGLDIGLDGKIAEALYTSITFDTQLFRFIRSSPVSHAIAAELLEFDFRPDIVHQSLFANQTVDKIAFLSKILGRIEYHLNGRIAILKIKDQDLVEHNLEVDDSRDVIDMIMNIKTVEAAALFREESTDHYKMSLRSKGGIEVLDIAEDCGGGGHKFAAGSYISGPYNEIKSQVVEKMKVLLSQSTVSI